MNAHDTSVSLRPAQPHDVDLLEPLETIIFGTDAWSRAALESELTGDYRHYFVLEASGGSVLGYAGVLALGGEADIQTIALTREGRGKGYGRLLLNTLLAEAADRGARQAFLEVRADNEPALSLYESAGFSQIGRREQYYQPDGVDAIVMRAAIGPGKGGKHE